MAGVVGRAFKIKKNKAKGYGYVKPGKFRQNPGVTTIAAINGRGSYRSARASMRGLSPNARMRRARTQLSGSEKKAFAARMKAARMSKNIGRMGRKRKNLKSNRRAVPAAAPMRRNRRRTSPGVHAANRRKTTTMKRNKRKSPALAANKRRRRRKTSKRRRKVSTSAKSPVRRKKKAGKRKARRKSRRKLRANKGTSAGAKKGWRTRRRKKASKRAAAPKRRRRRRKARASGTKRRRKTRKKATLKANRRRKKLSSNRRRRRVRRNKASMAPNRRRRRVRRNARSSKLSSNRRRKGRRRVRRNGSRSMFRKNSVGGALKTGAILLAGFGAHRVLSNLFESQVLSRLLPAPAPVATSGLDMLSKYSKPIAAVLVAGLGGFIANKVIKDESTKKLVIGGMVVSALHGVVMSVLNTLAPSAANMLAGPEDGTAARISAMYGLGHGASIMPRYAPISGGMGEYFTNPVNGMGEYFTNPVSGVGEYLAVQGMQGVGTYERNPNLMEAAAGMGAVMETQGNHIDPSSDLDRQLTIAEAAAGVGSLSPFEAAAGLQPFEASAGMGAITSLPGANTWIPGSSNPQLWAGTRPVNQPQSATEMVSAGVLQTEGGQGIFG